MSYVRALEGINPWFLSFSIVVTIPIGIHDEIERVVNDGDVFVTVTSVTKGQFNGTLLTDARILIKPLRQNETIRRLIEVVGLAYIRSINNIHRRARR